MKAVIITTSGEKSVVEFDNETCYKTLSDAVGGMIECVGIDENTDMWVNENGIAEGLPLNLHGSAIYAETWKASNPILGNVIITGGSDEEGYTLGLTDEQVEKWLAYNSQVIPTAYLFGALYN